MAAAVLLSGGMSACSDGRQEPVRIVGSSTIFPFAAKTAETYAERTGVVVVVEQTGSGGGHKLFCSGHASIDATTSSRPQKPSEAALCARNGVAPVIEIRLGNDGIVLARAVGAVPMDIDPLTLYSALARELPTSGLDCTPTPNPYERWSEIDPTLPTDMITVYGPPPTSGTRDAFVETAMEAGARAFPCLAAMEKDTPNIFRSRAHDLREDGRWIDAGENDNALIRTLANAPTTLGVFGFSFLDQNTDKVRGIAMGGVLPSQETIRNKSYPVVRDLFLYLRGGSALWADRGAADYVLEFTSEEASGPGGYLEEIGLIPLSDAERAEMRQRVERAKANAGPRP
ncbi:phosphate ABC transporter substrate-binding protein [Algimonas arctica]|uniref:Phosphate ABC transporter substrate-binding protein n=2 Tax=Algimonas arctica TaxID=1479486 RepID=A0A8J3CUF8_9PROT|nr:phosphate ABC transporter substrate-binding protein [Algimonas arctica]